MALINIPALAAFFHVTVGEIVIHTFLVGMVAKDAIVNQAAVVHQEMNGRVLTTEKANKGLLDILRTLQFDWYFIKQSWEHISNHEYELVATVVPPVFVYISEVGLPKVVHSSRDKAFFFFFVLVYWLVKHSFLSLHV